MTGPVIKIIADSVCDVPRDVAARLDITLIPTVVNIGARSYLDDDVQITRAEFFRLLPTLRELPTTSACPLGLTRDMIAARAAEADHLILLAAPAHLSAIYNNFRVAAEEFAPGRHSLIDTGQVTMGAGFLVLAAAELAAHGADAATIVAHVQAMQPHIFVYGALSTLENVRKSGRVGWATAMAGRILDIKPVVSLKQGDVRSMGNIRTFKRALSFLIDLARERAPLDRLAVMHTANLEGAYTVRDALADVFPPEDVLIVEANPSLGTHVGAQAVGVALVSKA